MSKIIVYLRPGGGLAVVVPAPYGRHPGESEEAWLERVAGRSVPADVEWQVVEREQLPTSRRWRAAWRLVAGRIVVDVQEARRIREQELLRQRERVLRQLREEIEQAEDEGEPSRLVRLRQKRRRLRNLETDLAGQLATLATLAELEEFVPAELREVG